MIAAWDVDQLDEAWVEALLGLSTIGRRGSGRAILQRAANRFRRNYEQRLH